jgi:tape measure domain-containing protein
MTSSEITLRFDLDARRVVEMVGQMVQGFERLNREMGQGVKSVQVSMGRSEEAVRKLGTGTEETRKSMQRMESSTRATESSVTSLAAHVAAATGTLRSLQGFLQMVLTTTMSLEKAQRTLEYATGDGAAAMAFVRRTCQELGLELVSTTQAYAKFAAATKGTNLAGYETQFIFRSIASASTVLGLSAEETSGILLSLSQMVSKNKVMAEELRGQLGERLPGAFIIAAKAMGVTTQQLDKMLQDGKVLATDFLPKFARELKATLGDQTYISSLGPAAQMNRLKNAFTDLLAAVGQSGPLKQASQDMGEMAKSLKDASENGVPRELGRFLAGTISITKGLASALWTCRQEVLGLAAAYGLFLGARIVGPFVDLINRKRQMVQATLADREQIIQAGLAEVGHTYNVNQNALAQVRKAQAMNAAAMSALELRVAMGALTVAEADAQRQAILTAQAKLAEAEAMAVGGRAAGFMAAATKALGGPIGWITLLLTVGVGAWVAWGGSSESAADQALKAAEKAERTRQSFEGMTGDLQELNKVLGDSKAKAEDKKRAQEQLNTVVKQMLLVYPELTGFVRKEGENYVFTLDALKRFTAQKKLDAEASVKNAQAKVAEAEALLANAAAQRTLSTFLGQAAGAAGTGAAALLDANKISGAQEGLTKYKEALQKTLAELQKWQEQDKRLNAPGGGGKDGKPGEESTTAMERLKADLEKRKFLFEKEAFERGQLVEFTKAMEATWLKENIGHYKLNTKERMQADKMLFEAERASLASREDAEVASLRRQMEEAKGQAMERLKLAESIEARVALRYGKESKEAQAAAAEVTRVKRDALQEDLRFQEAVADRQKATALAVVDVEVQALERQRELGTTRGMAYLVALSDLEARKYEIQRAALEKRMELMKLDPTHDPRQVEQLRSQLDALAAQYEAKKTDIRFKKEDETRKGDGAAGALKGIDDYIAQSQNAFENWRNVATQAIQGVEQSFASGIQGILSGQMSLGQGMKTIWKGIVNTVIQALAQMTAKWLVASIASKLFGEATAESASAQAVANQASAAAGIFAAHSYIPFVGPAIAAGLVAMMNMTLAANLASAKGMTAFAVGGLIDRPTVALMGEAGREVVAPEHDFKHWASNLVVMGANLQANLVSNQDRVDGYRRHASQTAWEAQLQAERNLAGGHPAFGGGGTVVDLRGSTFLSDSLSTKRELGRMMREAKVLTDGVS